MILLDWTVPKDAIVRAQIWLKTEALHPAEWPRTPDGRPAMITDRAWRQMEENVIDLIRAVVPDVQLGLNVRNVWLSALLGGQSIAPHSDEQPDGFRWRLHVPLRSNPDAYFIQNGHHVTVMEVGKAYRVNPRLRHAVWNAGETPRVHLMFDLYRTGS